VKLAFLVVAASSAGLPPFAGFVGKLMLLTALRQTAAGTATWIVLLGAGFLVMAALARQGCILLWKPPLERAPQPAVAPQPAAAVTWQQATATLLLVAAAPLLAILAGPLSDYAQRTAGQLQAPGAYVAGVLGAQAAATGNGVRR